MVGGRTEVGMKTELIAATHDEQVAFGVLVGLGLVLQGIVVGGPDLLTELELNPKAIGRIVGDAKRRTARLMPEGSWPNQ